MSAYQAFGDAATEWAALHELPEGAIVAEPSEFHNAVSALIARRASGLSALFIPLIELPKRALLRLVLRPLFPLNAPVDQRLINLAQFAQGHLAIDGTPQQVIETRLTEPHRLAYTDACLIADDVIFMTAYHVDLAASTYGTRPVRYSVAPLPLKESTTSHSAVLAPSNIYLLAMEPRNRPFGDIVEAALHTLPLTVVRVEDLPPPARVAPAACFICLDDDPAVAVEVALRGYRVASACEGVSQSNRSIHVFNVVNATEAADAVLRALGTAPSASSPSPYTQPIETKAGSEECVSIIMSVYNRLDELDANLARLQNQSYKNFECIVVSDAGPSPDAICAKYPNTTLVMKSARTGYPTRNEGLARAKGRYLAFLDDDDIFLDDHLDVMVSALKSGADLAYSDYILNIVDVVDNRFVTVGYDLVRSPAITPFGLYVNNMIGYLTVVAKRHVYDDLGGFDPIKIPTNQEVELWLRWSSKYVMAHVSKPTTMYTIPRNRSGSASQHIHAGYAVGFERLYELYPCDLLSVRARREQFIAELRSQVTPPVHEPRYHVLG